MATSMQYARAVRRTSSGMAIDRPTCISAFTVTPGTLDTIVALRDKGSAGAKLWEVEADNASGSHTVHFNPPLRFYHDVYMEFVQSGGNSSAQIAVLEP